MVLILIITIIVIYVILGLFIGALATDKNDFDRDNWIMLSGALWPFFLIAFIIIGIYEGTIKLADFLKSK